FLSHPSWLLGDSPRSAAAPATVATQSTSVATPATGLAAPERSSGPERSSAPGVEGSAPRLPFVIEPRRDVSRGSETRRADRPRSPNAPGSASATPATPTSESASAGTSGTARESERRATALIERGQTAQASSVFDSLLQSNPLYEPKPTELTPEALSTF